jgi:peroxiredoxin (alkyl hydroperoxide reductase subunit C)
MTNSSSVLVGKQAPDFTAVAVLADNEIIETFNLFEFTTDKYAVVFFYPLDFTFVCPSEILAIDNRYDEFAKRNTEVIAVSVDSQYSHIAWKNTPIHKGGLGPIQFPLVADISKSITRSYGVLRDAVALRGTFLIDRENVVRHQSINDLPLGRSIDETLRLIDALQFVEENGAVCPAGWQKGRPAMTASAEGVAEYLTQYAGSL